MADAGPIIHLGEIDALDLLETFDDCLVPETVIEEVERGGRPAGLDGLGYERIVAPPLDGFGDLDPGERAALSIATARDAILLTDDLAAREAATTAGVDVHGSIGVIAFGYARGAIDRETAAGQMRALHREASLFVSESVVERGIEMLDDQSDIL